MASPEGVIKVMIRPTRKMAAVIAAAVLVAGGIAARCFNANSSSSKIEAEVPNRNRAHIKNPLGIIWEPLAGDPLVTGSSGLSWRTAGATDPTIQRRADGSLTMWFTTMGIRKRANGAFAADGPWTGRAAANNAVFPHLIVEPEKPVVPLGDVGAWDRYVETPTVRVNASGHGWTMWYLGYTERSGPTGFLRPALGQMESENIEGTIWRRPSAPIYRPEAKAWDGTLVSGPTVLRGPDGIWRLYYCAWGIGGAVPRQGIGLLTSKDRVKWTPYPHNPVLEGKAGAWDEELLEPAAIYYKGKYWLWYSGTPHINKRLQIGLAMSDDGIHWSRCAHNPVLRPGPPGTWDDHGVLAPDVIVDKDGSLLMAAYGSSNEDVAKNRSSGSIGLWKSRP